MSKQNHHRKSGFLTFIICLLAIPAMTALSGGYEGEITYELLKPALMVGGVLGLLHLLLRPILRAIGAPLSCLTLGLFGMVIDVGLIYLAAHFVPGFEIPGLLNAVLTALGINIVGGMLNAGK